MLRAITLIESARRENRENQAEIIGIHLEGPFLHPEFSGIHPIKDLKKPDLKVLTSYLTAGVITSMTISPEVEGALDLIKFLTGMGVGVWIGYSSADIERSREALDAGAIGFTDL
jgi:N-acetylglucosamine-6-phosphate deacetylase